MEIPYIRQKLARFLFVCCMGIGLGPFSVSAQVVNGDFEAGGGGLGNWTHTPGVIAGPGLPPTPATGAHMPAGAGGVIVGANRYQIIQQTFTCPGPANGTCVIKVSLQHLPGAGESATLYLQNAGGARIANVPNIAIAADRKIGIPGCGTVTIGLFRKKAAGAGVFTGDLYFDGVQDNCQPPAGPVPFPGVPFLTTIDCPSSDPGCTDLAEAQSVLAINTIPTISQWGMILLALLMLVIGTIVAFKAKWKGNKVSS